MPRAVVALLLALLMVPAGLARADTPEKRIALVIGNGAYQLLRPQLPNPTADARDIGRSLQDLGFETTIKANVTRRDLYALIDAFGAKIADRKSTRLNSSH